MYLVWTDAASIKSKDTNIFFSYSDDAGATWSAPKQLNTDGTTTSQFFPAIAVDPKTGNLAVTWYDARGDKTNNKLVQLYGVASDDGGATFSANTQIAVKSSDATLAGTPQRGTATDARAPSGTSPARLVDTSKIWALHYWAGQDIRVTTAAGRTLYAKITDNTFDTLLVKPIDPSTWTVANVKGSSYSIGTQYNFDFGDYSSLAFYNGIFYPLWSDNSNSAGKNTNPDGANSALDLYTAQVQVKTKAKGTGSLNSPVDPSTVGQAVTFTATASGSGPIPTGTFTFFDGSNVLGTNPLDNSGNATFTTSTLAAGSHSISAVYNGDSNYDSLTTNTVTQQVEFASSSEVISIPQDITGNQGDIVTVPVNLQVSAPNGVTVGKTDVVLYYDPNKFSVSNIRLGSLLDGSQGFTLAADTSEAPGEIILSASSPTGTALLPANTLGSLFLLDFTVQGGPGASPINLQASYTTSQGTTYTDLADNSLNPLTLSPAPTNASGDTVDGVFTINPILPTVTLASSAPTTDVGQPVTFTATVTPTAPMPTGTITFLDGSDTLDTVPLASDGTATFTTSALTAADHDIFASYSGDSNYASNISADLVEVINQPPTVTGLSATTDTTSGGTQITMKGTSFTGATVVSFGTVSTTNFSVLRDDVMLVTVPAQSTAGTVDVTVTTPDGTSATSSADRFTYTAASQANWTGPSSGDWNTASNWSTGIIPTSSTDVSIPSGVTVTASGGSSTIHSLNVQGNLVVSGGSLNVNATSSISNLTLSGGSLGGAGPLTITNSMSWTGGSLIGPGTFVIGPAATLTLAGSTGTLTLQGITLQNQGTIIGTGTAGLDFEAGGYLDNQSTGLFDDQTDLGFTSQDGTGIFSNEGVLTESAGGGTITFGAGLTLENYGTIQVESGTLDLACGGFNTDFFGVASGTNILFEGNPFLLTSQSSISGDGAVSFAGGTTILGGTVNATAGITIQANAVVSGAGVLTGNVSNAGILNVGDVGTAGTVSIIGNYTQLASGVLDMEIGGLTAGTDFDQLPVSGTTVLDGTVNVTILNGFTPAPGNTFPLLTFASSTGTFATITGLQQNGFSFAPHYDSTDFSLSALGQVTTNLVSSLNPSPYAQSVTFTATVIPPNGGPTPTGQITFEDGSTELGTGNLSVVNGQDQATFTTSMLAVGSHSITAVYGGDPNYGQDTSSALTQTVVQVNTSTSLSSSNTSPLPGQSVIFTATVSAMGGTPTGTVTFYNGATELGSSTLAVVNGFDEATLTTSNLPLGNQSITAVYEGSTGFLGSSATLTEVVQQGATTTALSSSASPLLPGQSVTFTATVSASGGTPTGSVTFYDGTTALSTVSLAVVNGHDQAAYTTSLALGSHGITAIYGGDTSFAASSGSLTEMVQQASTSTTVSANPLSPQPGQSVTFTAMVSGMGSGTPAGTVTFYDGTSSLGSGTLSVVNGQDEATLSTSSLAQGSHAISVVYGGNTTFAASSGSLALVVGQPSGTSSSTMLSASTFSPLPGASVTFTATVSGMGSTPSGTVTFYDGTAVLGSGTLAVVSGQDEATLTTSSLALGSHAITAVYGGDSTFAPSSSSLSEVVQQGTTSLTLSSSATSSITGQSVTFTATVSAAGGTPAGSVTFYDGATVLGTVALAVVNGQDQAAFSTSNLALGTHVITAIYAGNSTFAVSTAPSVTLLVQQPSLTATGTTANATPGVAFNGGVATIFDQNALAQAGNFTIVIDWGDNTPTTSGTVTATGTQTVNGTTYNTFAVTGLHTYVNPGTYTVTISITDVGGASTETTTTITVAQAAPEESDPLPQLEPTAPWFATVLVRGLLPAAGAESPVLQTSPDEEPSPEDTLFGEGLTDRLLAPKGSLEELAPLLPVAEVPPRVSDVNQTPPSTAQAVARVPSVDTADVRLPGEPGETLRPAQPAVVPDALFIALAADAPGAVRETWLVDALVENPATVDSALADLMTLPLAILQAALTSL